MTQTGDYLQPATHQFYTALIETGADLIVDQADEDTTGEKFVIVVARGAKANMILSYLETAFGGPDIDEHLGEMTIEILP